jgi:membrane-associated phospholipid phosphatase
MTNLVYALGSYGPVILIILSWFLLWDSPNMCFYYTVGLFVNSLLNLILKGILQEPRPMFDAKKVHLMKTNTESHFYRNGIPFDVFGMPSGHVQASMFSTVFVYLTLRETKWMYYAYLPMTLLTAYQRVKFNFHTVSQVLVGSAVGSAFAYYVYKLAKDKIKNCIREKPDDDGPV